MDEIFLAARELRSELRAARMEGSPEFAAAANLLAHAEEVEQQIQREWDYLRERAATALRAAAPQGRGDRSRNNATA